MVGDSNVYTVEKTVLGFDSYETKAITVSKDIAVVFSLLIPAITKTLCHLLILLVFSAI